MDPRHCAIALAAVAAFASAASAETIRIEMENLGYKPSAVSAHVGDTIEWTNTDFLAHTATSRDKKWDVMLYPKRLFAVVQQLLRPRIHSYRDRNIAFGRKTE
jgi:plastocyanin